jgi:hypothetical protein
MGPVKGIAEGSMSIGERSKIVEVVRGAEFEVKFERFDALGGRNEGSVPS